MQKKIILLFSFLLVGIFAFAQTTAQRQQQYNLNGKHLALEGYDPVSYFQGKPQKGKSEFTAEQGGVTYRFASKANQEKFKSAPDKYEPAYGGWCAYAMAAKGEKVEVDPLTFKIVDGRLLVFYNAFFNNTLEKWNEMSISEKERLAKADRSWGKFLGK
ncbi:MAG: YHS domain-containing (seleno)protein [Saprospiraceae bacterium]